MTEPTYDPGWRPVPPPRRPRRSRWERLLPYLALAALIGANIYLSWRIGQ